MPLPLIMLERAITAEMPNWTDTDERLPANPARCFGRE